MITRVAGLSGLPYGMVVNRLALFRLPLSQPYSRAATVLIDELHSGGFQGAPYDLQSGTAGRVRAGFQLSDGYNTYAGFIGQLLLAPIQKPSSGSTLRRRNHDRIRKTRPVINSVENRLTCLLYPI